MSATSNIRLCYHKSIQSSKMLPHLLFIYFSTKPTKESTFETLLLYDKMQCMDSNSCTLPQHFSNIPISPIFALLSPGGAGMEIKSQFPFKTVSKWSKFLVVMQLWLYQFLLVMPAQCIHILIWDLNHSTKETFFECMDTFYQTGRGQNAIFAKQILSKLGENNINLNICLQCMTCCELLNRSVKKRVNKLNL